MGVTAVFIFQPFLSPVGVKSHLAPIPGLGAARIEPDGPKYMSWLGPSPQQQKKISGSKYSFAAGKTSQT